MASPAGGPLGHIGTNVGCKHCHCPSGRVQIGLGLWLAARRGTMLVSTSIVNVTISSPGAERPSIPATKRVFNCDEQIVKKD